MRVIRHINTCSRSDSRPAGGCLPPRLGARQGRTFSCGDGQTRALPERMTRSTGFRCARFGVADLTRDTRPTDREPPPCSRALGVVRRTQVSASITSIHPHSPHIHDPLSLPPPPCSLPFSSPPKNAGAEPAVEFVLTPGHAYDAEMPSLRTLYAGRMGALFRRSGCYGSIHSGQHVSRLTMVWEARHSTVALPRGRLRDRWRPSLTAVSRVNL